MSFNSYPVNWEDLHNFMEKRGLNRKDVARLLRVNVRTVSNWRGGKVQMPFASWFCLRALAARNEDAGSYDPINPE